MHVLLYLQKNSCSATGDDVFHVTLTFNTNFILKIAGLELALALWEFCYCFSLYELECFEFSTCPM